jgi:small-conductance mechanosensitive channel
MKLLYEAWSANDPYDWLIAGALLVAGILALGLVKSILRRIVPRLCAARATGAHEVIARGVDATKLWLLFPAALLLALSSVELPAKLEQIARVAAIAGLLAQSAAWITSLIGAWTERHISERSRDGHAVTALAMMGFAARVLVWTFAFLIMLDQLEFDITALVAGLGIGGIAVALAVQNVLGDLLGSLAIVMDKPFVVGDEISVSGVQGTVERIGIKTTRVRALSGELIIFSNNDLLKSTIHNWQRMDERRVPFTVEVVQDTPPDVLERIPAMLKEAIESQPKTRFVRAHFKACGAYAFIFEAVYHVLSREYRVYMDVHQAVNLGIVRAFADHGIAFAYPTQTVLVRSEASPAAGVTRDRVNAGTNPAGGASTPPMQGSAQRRISSAA